MEVLIVGAGPTGLVMALCLSQFGIPFRIIDKNSGPGQTSRAMAVQARTLEFYQQINIAREIVNQGIVIERIEMKKNNRSVATINLGSLGEQLSPFPFVLSFPQDDHEKFLIEQLALAGVTIERNTELLNLSQENNKVIATLKKQNEIETLHTSFLLGCDGARSTVRNALDIYFPGGTYSQLYFVADVTTEEKHINNQLQVCFIKNAFLLLFPIRSTGSMRLIGIVPENLVNKENIEFSDLEQEVIKNTQLTILKVNWFSTYHSHHRVAERLKKGNIFLLGDAGHIHSPVGGQGMNTGIGDAINLAWKIAAVIKKNASPILLDTYEPERMAFAHQLVKTTDRLFQAITNKSWLGNVTRNFIFPNVMPFLTRFTFFKKFLFKTVSQIKINYHASALSQGKAGKIHGGDRLPWVHGNDFDNFTALKTLTWQIHIYGTATDSLKHTIAAFNIKIYEFPWTPSAVKAGLKKNAVYLIRPDGYVGYAGDSEDDQGLKQYILDSANVS